MRSDSVAKGFSFDLADFAMLAAFVMILTAGALFAHSYQTNRWMSEIKAGAMARVRDGRRDEVATSRENSDSCPIERPVLIGFDGSGHARCRALASQSCPSGQYISSIDPSTLDVHCSEAGAELNCPAGQYITEFMWLGENHVSYSCFPRLDPFAAWKFEPTLSSRGAY